MRKPSQSKRAITYWWARIRNDCSSRISVQELLEAEEVPDDVFAHRGSLATVKVLSLQLTGPDQRVQRGVGDSTDIRRPRDARRVAPLDRQHAVAVVGHVARAVISEDVAGVVEDDVEDDVDAAGG